MDNSTNAVGWGWATAAIAFVVLVAGVLVWYGSTASSSPSIPNTGTQTNDTSSLPAATPSGGVGTSY